MHERPIGLICILLAISCVAGAAAVYFVATIDWPNLRRSFSPFAAIGCAFICVFFFQWAWNEEYAGTEKQGDDRWLRLFFKLFSKRR